MICLGQLYDHLPGKELLILLSARVILQLVLLLCVTFPVGHGMRLYLFLIIDRPDIRRLLITKNNPLGVFTEKPCSKPLKRNVVDIPMTSSSHTR